MSPGDLRVVIVDDETARAKRWCSSLEAASVPGIQARALEKVEVEELLRTLNARRLLARKKEDWRKVACEADNADVLLLDFDLIDLGKQAEFSTGEEVAYLARVLSGANVVCVINQFGTNRFDLTMRADVEGRSDLDLGSSQLANPGLWKEIDHDSGIFRPWSWPVLSAEVGRYRERIDYVAGNRTAPILETLGFDLTGSKPTRALPKTSLSWFQKRPEAVTFGGLVSSVSFVHPKDVDWLAADPAQSDRVAAAALHKWLERVVLARQDVLVDAPHLISRKPWLLAQPKEASSWMQVLASGIPAPSGPLLEKFAFAPKCLLSRAAYWGEDISESEVAFPKDGWKYEELPDLVFLEDMSTFASRDKSLEYDCQLGSTYDLRFVCDTSKLPPGRKDFSPRDVEYVPAVWLTL